MLQNSHSILFFWHFASTSFFSATVSMNHTLPLSSFCHSLSNASLTLGMRSAFGIDTGWWMSPQYVSDMSPAVETLSWWSACAENAILGTGCPCFWLWSFKIQQVQVSKLQLPLLPLVPYQIGLVRHPDTFDILVYAQPEWTCCLHLCQVPCLVDILSTMVWMVAIQQTNLVSFLFACSIHLYGSILVILSSEL